jgi:hypothetical protein
MSDDADITEERMGIELERLISAARRSVPPGHAGECDRCGEFTKRLIDNNCAPCRDKIERMQARGHYKVQP